jgi:hypothetical protein
MTTPTVAEELSARVAGLISQVEELHQRLDQTTGLPGTATPTSADGKAEAEPELKFHTVEQWVTGLFLPLFSWRVDGQRWYWCEQWWAHAEAIWRLELLWRGWEAARWQPTGMSAWSMELDHHVRELCGDEGPFRQCRVGERDRAARHVELEAASTRPAPAGWWNA